MKQVVIISGKGGTGKTSVTASFGYLAGKDAVIADCDVDAADMHLVTEPRTLEKRDFYSGYEAVIDSEMCAGCGDCMQVCHFNAVEPDGNVYKVIPVECEGCGYCARICPVEAIEMKLLKAGEIFVSQTRMDNLLVHARLGIGSDMSGKLVSEVRKEAKRCATKKKVKYILIDGSPGIGCPVTASITGTDYVVFVTEPTLSGMHDLERVMEVIHNFNLPAGCIINKADINTELTEALKKFVARNKLDLLAIIPYDKHFSEAINTGKSVVEENNEVASLLKKAWRLLEEKLMTKI